MKNKKPLQVGGVFLCFETKLFHHIEAGTGFLGIEVMMPNNQGAGVTLAEVFEQQPHRRLLLSRARVGGLTADIEPAFVADADRMGIVVQTVGTDHPFRPTGLNLSVTTDHVVVADTFIMSVFAMPPVDIFRRRCTVGLHCRTMNN